MLQKKWFYVFLIEEGDLILFEHFCKKLMNVEG